MSQPAQAQANSPKKGCLIGQSWYECADREPTPWEVNYSIFGATGNQSVNKNVVIDGGSPGDIRSVIVSDIAATSPGLLRAGYAAIGYLLCSEISPLGTVDDQTRHVSDIQESYGVSTAYAPHQVTPRVITCQDGTNTVAPASGAGSYLRYHVCPVGFSEASSLALIDAPKPCVKALPALEADPGQCKAGNPVYPSTGMKTHSETDFSGAGASPLSFVRHYRADRINKQADTIAEGWQHNWQQRIIDKVAGNPRSPVAIRSNGQLLRFTLLSSIFDPTTALITDTYRTVTVPSDTLVRVRRLTNPSSSSASPSVDISWSLRVFADDSTETYNDRGQITRITERNGNLWQLSYAAARLITVRNPYGRELRLAYDAQNRLSQLLPPGAIQDSGAGATTSLIRYGYDNQGNLATVTWQDGTTRWYHYEDSRWLNALTGITDEAGVRISTYTYNAAGQVASEIKAGGVDRLEFAYGPGFTQVVDYSTGTQKVTDFNYETATGQGYRRLTSVSAPCPMCGTSQARTQYTGQGQVSRSVGHDGTVTYVVYDALGRETERATFPSAYASAVTRPALNLATSVVSTQWHATWFLPLKVAEANYIAAYTYNSKGMMTGEAKTPTTDLTGALKFAALRNATQPIKSEGWSYGTTNLVTTTLQKIDNVTQTKVSYTYRTASTANYSIADIATEKIERPAALPVPPVETTTFTAMHASGGVKAFNTAGGTKLALAHSLPINSRGMASGYSFTTAAGSVAGAGQQTLTYTFNARAQIATAALPGGVVLTMLYDTLGRMVGFSNSLGDRSDYTLAVGGGIWSKVDTGNVGRLYSHAAIALDPEGYALLQGATAVPAISPSIVNPISKWWDQTKRDLGGSLWQVKVTTPVPNTPMICVYVISNSTMTCNTKGVIWVIPGWTSGGPGCRNNPDCFHVKDKGPAPPGQYYGQPRQPGIGNASNGYSQSNRPGRFYGARRMFPIGAGGTVNITPDSSGTRVDVGGGVTRDNFMTHHCQPTDEYCNMGCLSQTDKDVIDKWNNAVDANNGVMITVRGRPK